MKKIIFAICTILAAQNISFAQTEKMIVEKTNGSKDEYVVDRISKVYFENVSDETNYKPLELHTGIKKITYNYGGKDYESFRLLYGNNGYLSSIINKYDEVVTFSEDMTKASEVYNDYSDTSRIDYNLSFNQYGYVNRLSFNHISTYRSSLDFLEKTEGEGTIDINYLDNGLISSIIINATQIYKLIKEGDDVVETENYTLKSSYNIKYNKNVISKIIYNEEYNKKAPDDSRFEEDLVDREDVELEFFGKETENIFGTYDILTMFIIDEDGLWDEWIILDGLALAGYLGKWSLKLPSNCSYYCMWHDYEDDDSGSEEYEYNLNYGLNDDGTIGSASIAEDETNFQYNYTSTRANFAPQTRSLGGRVARKRNRMLNHK